MKMCKSGRWFAVFILLIDSCGNILVVLQKEFMFLVYIEIKFHTASFIFQKSTKTALETGRTFSTLFADIEFRFDLQNATSEYEFKKLLRDRTKHLIKEHSLPENRKSHLALPVNPFDDDGTEVGEVFLILIQMSFFIWSITADIPFTDLTRLILMIFQL